MNDISLIVRSGFGVKIGGKALLYVFSQMLEKISKADYLWKEIV